MSYLKPSVFIIEDDKPQRVGMRLKLEARGFQVSSAESIADGKRILKEKGDKFDVILTDMRLDAFIDGKTGLTGADLVIDFYKEKAKDGHFQRPEPIVLSAFKEVDLYQKAFSLGAAAYLDKAAYSSESVIRHLRALAIKSILNNNSNRVDMIDSVILKSNSEADLYENLCSDILGKVFSDCLGSPFVFLLTEFSNSFLLRAKNCANCSNDFPLGEDEIYKEILSLMYSNSDTSKPFVLDEDNFSMLRKQGSELSDEQIGKFKDSAFISLHLAGGFGLSIGILKDNTQYSEPPMEMARLLISYVNPTLSTFISKSVAYSVKVRFLENIAEREITIKRLASFCNNVGSEQLYILEDADLINKDSDNYLDSKTYQHIKGLAEDLCQTGRLLEPIADRSFSTEPLPLISMKDLIIGAWKELESEADFANKIDISVTGNCQVQGEKEDFWLVAFRLLHWFSRRRFEVPDGSKHSIKATCSEGENEAVIVFEDNSYRLPSELREKLFNAFSPATPPPTSDDISEKHRPGLYLALYLSQIIIEEKYRGNLIECSDDLSAELGHRIEIRIPLSK
jgi:CheY-like chemotaxis protein